VRYIGSKARLVDDLIEIIGRPRGESHFVDGFCGTGVVAARAADEGWSVRLNDNLQSAVVIAAAQLLSREEVPFGRWGGYHKVIDWLNSLKPVRGYFWREYSPGGSSGRRYFTAENAARIDAVRQRLGQLEEAGELSVGESILLRADLIAAADRVASIAGTYGCYLASWTDAALRPFAMTSRPLRDVAVRRSVYCGDVVDTPIGENDVAYFDPPYTKRQYAAYYHINETLAAGDEPTILGKTGLRPWKDRASDYCYKAKALGALVGLIHNTPARRILISYSSQGHLSLDQLEEGLSEEGEVTFHELGPIGRYRPNRAASLGGSRVTEFLIELNRVPVGVATL
jgi:adenine-specific DNA-methyltransferase